MCRMALSGMDRAVASLLHAGKANAILDDQQTGCAIVKLAGKHYAHHNRGRRLARLTGTKSRLPVGLGFSAGREIASRSASKHA
jgi:hypothetical protein